MEGMENDWCEIVLDMVLIVIAIKESFSFKVEVRFKKREWEIPIKFALRVSKQDDLSSCDNWSGIMLLCIPGSALYKVLLNWFNRNAQEEFRQGRSYIDHFACHKSDNFLNFELACFCWFIAKPSKSQSKAVLPDL